MKKIRLFVDAHIFDKEPQGTRTFIKEIYNILSKDFSEFEIFIGAQDIQNIKTHFPYVKEENFIKFYSKSSYFRLGFEIPYHILKNRIDFAHFQYIVPPIKFCKYIVTTHDILFYDFPKDFSFLYKKVNGFLFKRSAALSDIITTVSSYSKKAIAKYFNIPLNDIYILPNGVNNDFFKPYLKQTYQAEIASKYGVRNYILYVSRIERRKNHELLIDVYKELHLYNKNIQLVLIGNNSIPVKSLNKKLLELKPNLKKNIHWFKNIEDGDLHKFYKAARLFVYPSKAEGFGIPPLEAVAFNIDTLCANSTAMKDFEFLKENKFDPNNKEDLKAKLSHALSNGPNHSVLAQRAEYVKENYSWDKTAKKLSQLIINYF